MNIIKNVSADAFPLKAGDNLIMLVPHHDDTILGCGNFVTEAQEIGRAHV